MRTTSSMPLVASRGRAGLGCKSSTRTSRSESISHQRRLRSHRLGDSSTNSARCLVRQPWSPLTHGLVCAAAGDDQRKKLLKQHTCTQLTMSSSATPEATTASDLTCKKKRKTKGVRRREAHHQPGGGGTAEDDFQHVVLLCRKLHEGGHNDVSSPPTPVVRTSQIKNRPSSEPATTKPWEPTVDGKPVKQLSP